MTFHFWQWSLLAWTFFLGGMCLGGYLLGSIAFDRGYNRGRRDLADEIERATWPDEFCTCGKPGRCEVHGIITTGETRNASSRHDG